MAWSRLAASFIASLMAATSFAANPILPGWEYIPDGEPRVFGDRIYLYGSHDRAGSKSFCDYILKVWSAPLNDPNNWRDEGISFSTRDQDGHKDDVPWSDHELYAPDVVENNGKFYLYAFIVGAPAAVAVSDTPAGPFKLVSKITAPKDAPNDFGGWGQYADPGVLVDDDGKVYIYWGFKQSHMAQLNPANMFEILPGTYQADIIPKEKPFRFFEAASPRKINGIYYMIYADFGTMVYATSTSPTGPFKYGGPIIRNGGDSPGGNIHGSLCQVNGQWYVFYHRMTNRTIFSRRACVEPVTIEADGSIKEVEQTSLGFQKSLDPYAETPADIACVLRGGNYITELDRQTRPVMENRNGSVIGYRYFDFGTGVDAQQLTVRLRSGGTPGRMEIWIDAVDTGTKIGVIEIAEAPGEPWRDLSTAVSKVTGRHALFFRFEGGQENQPICDVASFRFSQGGK